MMKALVLDKPGIANLRLKEVKMPAVSTGEVLIRVKMLGLNPADRSAVTGRFPARPNPHIAGLEFAGIVERLGNGVKGLRPGDRVAVYPYIFCGKCAMCANSTEMLCKNRRGWGLIGLDYTGGFSEYAVLPAKNLVKLPSGTSWEVAASLPIAALTSYHAVVEAALKKGDTLLVFGASGNTGMFAVQLGKLMGASVIAVSSKRWLGTELDADYVIGRKNVTSVVKGITRHNMADVVINSVGAAVWDDSVGSLAQLGRLCVFGSYITGHRVNFAIDDLYAKNARILGVTGGTIREFKELVGLSGRLKVKVWKRFRLEEGREALKALNSKDRDGRVMLKITRF